MFSSPLYPFRRAIVCCAPRIHVLVSSLSLSPRDCLFHATNTCSRLLFIPFAARLSVARHADLLRAARTCGDRLLRQNAPHLSGFLDAYDHRPLSMSESLGVYGLTCRFAPFL